jgi:thioredoxin 1
MLQAVRWWHKLVAGCNFFASSGSVTVRNDKPSDTMKPIVELNETNFASEVLKAVGPVLVAFYASWCGPCKMLAPFLQQLAVEFTGKMKFARLNVDAAPGLAGSHDITGVPTLMLFRGGKAVDQLVGLASPPLLKMWLEKAANETVIA